MRTTVSAPFIVSILLGLTGLFVSCSTTNQDLNTHDSSVLSQDLVIQENSTRNNGLKFTTLNIETHFPVFYSADIKNSIDIAEFEGDYIAHLELIHKKTNTLLKPTVLHWHVGRSRLKISENPRNDKRLYNEAVRLTKIYEFAFIDSSDSFEDYTILNHINYKDGIVYTEEIKPETIQEPGSKLFVFHPSVLGLKAPLPVKISRPSQNEDRNVKYKTSSGFGPLEPNNKDIMFVPWVDACVPFIIDIFSDDQNSCSGTWINSADMEQINSLNDLPIDISVRRNRLGVDIEIGGKFSASGFPDLDFNTLNFKYSLLQKNQKLLVGETLSTDGLFHERKRIALLDYKIDKNCNQVESELYIDFEDELLRDQLFSVNWDLDSNSIPKVTILVQPSTIDIKISSLIEQEFNNMSPDILSGNMSLNAVIVDRKAGVDFRSNNIVKLGANGISIPIPYLPEYQGSIEYGLQLPFGCLANPIFEIRNYQRTIRGSLNSAIRNIDFKIKHYTDYLSFEAFNYLAGNKILDESVNPFSELLVASHERNKQFFEGAVEPQWLMLRERGIGINGQNISLDCYLPYVYNLAGRSSKNVANRMLVDKIFPFVYELDQVIDSVSEIRNIVVSVSYQVKDFTNDKSKEQNQRLALEFIKSEFYRWLKNDITDLDLLSNSVATINGRRASFNLE